jgi:hypothetical protein
MNGKFLVVGTLAAAIALFVWQFISNGVLPWHEATMHAWEGPANDAVVQTIRANAPENGVYVSDQGVLAAVALRPDLSDRMQPMGPMMIKQFVVDLVVAFLLAVVLLRSGPMMPSRAAVTFAIAGLAAGAVTELSNWIWYGFDFAFSVVNVIELAVSWFVVGFVLTIVQRRLARMPATTGVRAQGGVEMGSESTVRR